MVNGLETYVFPSSFTNDLTECCKGCHIPKNENLPENIFKNYQRNVVARGQCPGINQKIFDITVCNVRAAATIVQSMRQNLCLEIDKYDIDKEDEMLADIEDAMQFHLKEIGKGRESYLSELSKFVGIFWHSEARLLSYLYRNSDAIGQYISKVASPSVKLDVILLHMHSTHNICDHCRLQLTGAMYNWLYKGMITNLKVSDELAPIIHMVISWSDTPRSTIHYKRKTEDAEIDLIEVASVKHAKVPFSKDTKPFVSIVRLTRPDASSIGSIVAEEGKEEK